MCWEVSSRSVLKGGEGVSEMQLFVELNGVVLINTLA